MSAGEKHGAGVEQAGNEIFISLRSGKYGPVAVSSSDGSGGATLSNYQHWVKVGSVTYSCYERSLNSAQIAANVEAQINGSDPNCTATVGGQYNNEILITLKTGVAGPVAVSSSDGSAAASLTPGTDAATVLNNIASQINGTNWMLNGPVVLSASVVLPNQLIITAAPGADGNMVAFYQTDNNASSRLYFTSSNWNLSGGSSDNVSWHVHIDFTTLGWNNVDKIWWTIAPALPNSQAYQSTEWQIIVTNWTVTSSPASKRALKVAGPGSVRIEEDSTWVSTSGYWEAAPGNDPVNGAFAFWSQGRAIRAAAASASVTIETQVGGFVQQLAVAYVSHGYLFYVTGEIPEKKDPRAIDEKLVAKYGLAIGKAARARRKAAGLANVQYLRYGRVFVLLSTSGRHEFFEEEREVIRDARRAPINFAGYSVSYREGHPHVRIEQGGYLMLKAYLADLAVHRTKEWFEEAFRRLPFEPYAPVRGQLHGILREVNRRRALAQYELLSRSCIRVRRRVISPFAQDADSPDATEATIGLRTSNAA